MRSLTLRLASPYVGLRPFTEWETLLFFGRDAHVRNLLTKLRGEQRFIAVLGASGSGKSSLVRAGLIPALRRGALTSEKHNWNVCIFTPGDAPITNLAQALVKDQRWRDDEDAEMCVSALSATLASSSLGLRDIFLRRADRFPGESLLLVVDQFEEIFRIRQKSADHAEAFINLLLRTASEDVPIYVVLTMRSDFLGSCVAFLGLPEAINQGMYLTPRLDPGQLRSVIASPLGLVGGKIAPVLVSKLINTLGSEDELPILEHALLRMWNCARNEERRNIREEDFAEVCAPGRAKLDPNGEEHVSTDPKLAFAINNHAAEIFDNLSPECQLAARQIFLALIEHREEKVLRHPLELRQLTNRIGQAQRNCLPVVLDAFRAEGVGFLLPSMSVALREDTVIDISHESLFRQWRRFKRWISEEAQDILELREWKHRAERHLEYGGWLDEQDCHRALRWRDRVSKHGAENAWADHYAGEGSFERVDGYIQSSLEQISRERAERERLEREVQEARVLQLEAQATRLESEAAQQKIAAEQAAREQLRAEKEKKQAELLARTRGRMTRVAFLAFGFTLIFAIVAAITAWVAIQAKHKAVASDLAASAENIALENPDECLLLAIEAWKLDPVPKVEALMRWVEGNYVYDSILRGHDQGVTTVKYSGNGKLLMTASEDRTVRLWDVKTGKVLHVLRGHTGKVYDADFSPDGKSLVTASQDSTARIWDVHSGQQLFVLKSGSSGIYSVKFSSDGEQIATSSGRSFSGDNTARLWDAHSGQLLHELNGHRGAVGAVEFSPDARVLATASDDSTARLWDTRTGKELQVLRGHLDALTSMEFSTDGSTLATGSNDRTIRLWDTRNGKLLRTLVGHEGAVNDARFSPDGKTLASAGDDKTVRFWDVGTGRQTGVMRGHDAPIYFIEFSPDGKILTSASQDKTARLWDVSSRKQLMVMRGHSGAVYASTFSPDGKYVATASEDKTARLWDVRHGRPPQILQASGANIAGGAIDLTYQVIEQFSPDGETLATTSRSGADANSLVYLWETQSGVLLQVLDTGNSDGIKQIQYAPKGEVLATLGFNDDVRLWNVRDGKVVLTLPRVGGVSDMEFSPDGNSLATADADGTTKIWDAHDGHSIKVLSAGTSGIRTVRFSPDGKLIATGDMDRSARLWDIESGRVLQIFGGHDEFVDTVQFSPNGNVLATASDMLNSSDSAVRLRDVHTGKSLQVLGGHEGGVYSVTFSKDGNLLATATTNVFSKESAARVWDVQSGRELQNLRGHGERINTVRFSPDGTTLATGHDDNTARLWDLGSGKELQILRGHDAAVTSVQFSRDGKTIATASRDGTVRLWSCDVCMRDTDIASQFMSRIGRDLTEDERRRFGVPN